MKKTTPTDRSLIIIETGLVFAMTSLSGGFYLAGDIFKRFSKYGYAIGAQLDSYSLELLEYTGSALEKFVWKELHE